MERTAWAMPQTIVQKFSADEYVSACWGVACSVEKANKWEKDHGLFTKVQHNAENCGRTSNQVLIDVDDDNIPDKMIEVGTQGLGDLECILYQDALYDSNHTKPVNSVEPGDYIYWTTSASDGRIWHHQGSVQWDSSNKS